MILTGNQIRREVYKKNIIIEPFIASQINPNSYNYRLGNEYIELSGEEGYYNILGGNVTQPTLLIPEEGLVLSPGRLYLCNTFETIGSYHFVTSLIGKSSMGRLGLFLQASADLGHQGEIHQWTLELTCCIPIRIYPRMLIGQVTFWKPIGENYRSKGYYGKFDAPTQRQEGLK